jgi:6-pyruvoyltetrahydropterin/6-carboxytetrahydropterin synthase
MYTIKKEFAFSAAHWLEDLPKDHPCSRLHGHNYIVTVELMNKELDTPGMVKDYRALTPIKDYIDNTLDHRCLNEVLSFNPTAENIAKYIYQLFKKKFPLINAVEVSETPKTNARYTPEYD